MSSLSSIVILAVNPSRQIDAALQQKRLSDALEIQKAIEQYYIDTRSFPTQETIPTGAENALPICRNSIDFATCINVSQIVPDYIPCVPYEQWSDGPFYTGFKLYQDTYSRLHVTATHAQSLSLFNQGCDRMILPGGYWDFESAVANATDQSGHGNTAVPTGLTGNGDPNLPFAIAYGPQMEITNTLSYYFGGWTAFHGTSYMNIATGDNLQFGWHEPFSISIWAYIAPSLQKHVWTLVDKRDTSTAAKTGMIFKLEDKNESYFYPDVASFELVNDDSTGNKIYVSTTPTNTLFSQTFNGGLFNHYVMTYDGSGLASGVKIYLNGNELPIVVNTNALSADTRNSATAKIGGGTVEESFFGFMDEARIFDRVLTPIQIKTLLQGSL